MSAISLAGSWETGLESFTTSGTATRNTSRPRTGSWAIEIGTGGSVGRTFTGTFLAGGAVTVSVWCEAGGYSPRLITSGCGIYDDYLTSGVSYAQTVRSFVLPSSGSSIQVTFGISGSGFLYYDDWAFTYTPPPTDLAVRDGGTWKGAELYVRDAGLWKPADLYARDAGIWKKST